MKTVINFPINGAKNWGHESLSSISKIQLSNVDKKTIKGEIPVLLCNYTDVYNNNEITEKIAFMKASASNNEILKFSLNVGDVLITKDSETWKDIAVPAFVAGVFEGVLCGYHLAHIRPIFELIDGKYLFYLFQINEFVHQFRLAATGVTRYGLSVKSIEQSVIPIPPLPEQHRIATVLSTIDDCIEKTEALIAKLNSVKAGLMQDLLTRGVDDEGRIRTESTHEFKDTAIGRVPVEWDVRKFSEIFNFPCGQVDPRQYPYCDMLSVGSDNIESDSGNLQNLMIARECNLISGKYQFTSGMILYSKIRPYLNKVAFVDFEGLCSSDIYPLSLKDSHASVFFYFQYLISKFFLNQAMSYQDRTGIPKINREEMERILLPFPDYQEQSRIGEILFQFSNKLNVEIETVNKYRLTKSGLMTDLLTGKIRIPETIASSS